MKPTSILALVAGSVAAVGLAAAPAARSGAQVVPAAATFDVTSPLLSPYVVPADVCSVTIEAIGAAGGIDGDAGHRGLEGLGAIVTATFAVVPGETLWVSAGGAGSWDEGVPGGRNGGGAGGREMTSFSFIHGSGGGGASDVRRGGQGLDDRIVVAGGGGGAAEYVEYGPIEGFRGGAGGFPAGTHGIATSRTGDGVPTVPEAAARGGGQSADPGNGRYTPGSFGAGATSDQSGGGGGGWYGGGAGLSPFGDGVGSSGGGGSSHVDAAATAVTHGVAQAPGDGRVTITPAACPPATTTTTTTVAPTTTTTTPTDPSTTSSTVAPGSPTAPTTSTPASSTTSTTSPTTTTAPAPSTTSTVPTTSATVDVAATIASDPPVARLGQRVALTVTVVNRTAVSAANTRAEVRLGDGLVYVDASATEAFVPQTGVWSLGALAPGGRVTLVIGAIATRPGLVVSSVEVAADGDRDATNNQARSEVRVDTETLPITGGTMPVWTGALVVGLGSALVLVARRRA